MTTTKNQISYFGFNFNQKYTYRIICLYKIILTKPEYEGQKYNIIISYQHSGGQNITVQNNIPFIIRFYIAITSINKTLENSFIPQKSF